MVKPCRTSLFFLALASLSACSSGEQQEAEVGVSQILLGGAMNERQEIEEQQVFFAPTQSTFFAHAFVTGLSQSTEIVGAWWYGDRQNKIYESRVAVTPDRPVAKFQLQSSQEWPQGDYIFVVSSAGEELFEKEFRVGETE